MNEEFYKIFNNPNIIQKIQEKLPQLFYLAEADNMRDGKLGMEIGSTRERIIIAFFISQFGKDYVNSTISITESETDVFVFNRPISIKTITNKNIIGVKLIWTVDAQKALGFIENYIPKADIFLVHIHWLQSGGLYFIPQDAQSEILTSYGQEFYFKLPKQGTNPRGVELSNQAMNKLITHPLTQKIDILWHRTNSDIHNPYQRWIDLWNEG